jgi:two-component system NarL family sensor kinase
MNISPLMNPPAPSPIPFPGANDWAEMLARIGEKHSRLSRFAAGIAVRRRNGPSIMAEIERERARIARELHAGAGQPLAGIKMNLELLDGWIQSASEALPKEAGEAIARIHGLTESALGQIRSVSHRLHPPDWQNLAVHDALRLLVEESGIGERCATTLRLDPLPEEPDHAVRVALYRCAQESVANVLRHSGATKFSLSLTSAAGLIHLTLRDDGRGIPEEALRRGGIGLMSIREHSRSVGGMSRVASDLDGTTIQVSVPFTED